MSDIGPYGTLGNADAAAVTANVLVGERAGNVTDFQSDPRFALSRDSTAPYVPPRDSDARYDDDGRRLCDGKDNTCLNFCVRGTIRCRWHQT